MLKQFWTSCNGDDRHHVLIQTKAEFSHAVAVMFKVNGWSKEGWEMFDEQRNLRDIGLHVSLHQGRYMQWSKIRGRIQESRQ